MNFIHYNLGHKSRGEIIEITLTNGANVRLLDSTNFSNYKNGRRHRYHGGLVRRSPFNISIPSSGHWHIAIDMQGLRGTTRASVRTLPGPLPVATENTPLTEVPSLIQSPKNNIEDDDTIYDVFISHASEDKDQVARPLAKHLEDLHLKVWYDELSLQIGDSLRRKIDHGLARSRFGIVILSNNFISKGWTNYELDGIITKSLTNEQIILPIWHNITKSEVIEYSPSLADKVARNTASNTLQEIAHEISEVIGASS